MAKTPSNNIGGAAFNLLGLLRAIFTLKGAVSITLILVILTGLTALSEAIDKGSIKPFVKRVGGELLNHDNKLYIESLKIERNQGLLVNTDGEDIGFFAKLKALWEIIKTSSRLLINLWYLWTFAVVFYTLSVVLFTNNESAKLSNILVTILLLVVLQIGANFIIIDEGIFDEAYEGYEYSTKEKFIPFKGLFKFIDVAPLAFHPVYSKFVEDTPETVENLTNSTGDAESSIINSINMMKGDAA